MSIDKKSRVFVRDSVNEFIWDSVQGSVMDSIRIPTYDTFRDSITGYVILFVENFICCVSGDSPENSLQNFLNDYNYEK